MKRYIDADKLEKAVNVPSMFDINKDDVIALIAEQPTADVVEVKRKNPDDENCVICNSELDEAGTGGIWDLAGEICSVLNLDGEHDEQDTIYNIIREYIEQQEYCPKCGAKTEGAIHNDKRKCIIQSESISRQSCDKAN